MPIYEYQCDACGARREFIQKFSDEPKTQCPQCGETSLRKLVSAAAFHLKGNGWYVTDFRDGGKNTDSAKSAEKTEDTKVKTDEKTEDKKENKSENKKNADKKEDSQSKAVKSSSKNDTSDT